VPEREREDLFHEGQKEKDRRDKEDKRLDKKRKASALRELLESITSIQVGQSRMFYIYTQPKPK